MPTDITAGVIPAPPKQLLPKDLLLEVELSGNSTARIKIMLERFQALALQTAWTPDQQVTSQQITQQARAIIENTFGNHSIPKRMRQL